MQYLYHGVPQQIIGHRLMPLNQMQAVNPELCGQYLQKYKSRQEILQKRVPLLDCLWNDVVHFLPLQPEKVFGLQVELGLTPDMPAYKFFKIDLAQLDPNKTVVYFKTALGEQNTEVKWLRDVDLSTIQEVPEATKNYYQSLIGTGERPFNYQFIPHVLYKGSLDISKARIITL